MNSGDFLYFTANSLINIVEVVFPWFILIGNVQLLKSTKRLLLTTHLLDIEPGTNINKK